MPGSEVVGGYYFGQSGAGPLGPGVLIDWPANTNSGYLLHATSTANMVLQFPPIEVNQDESYTFSAYSVPEVGSAPRTIQLTIVYKNSGGTPLQTVQGSFVETSGAFQRGATIDAVTPIGTTQAVLSITIENPADGEGHYLGGLLFEPSAYLQGYFDANFAPGTDYLFEGTPNQSISDYYPALAAKVSRLATVMSDFTPIGSTYSIEAGQQAFTNVGEAG